MAVQKVAVMAASKDVVKVGLWAASKADAKVVLLDVSKVAGTVDPRVGVMAVPLACAMAASMADPLGLMLVA